MIVSFSSNYTYCFFFVSVWQILMHFGLQLCGPLLPTCQTRSPSFLHGSLSLQLSEKSPHIQIHAQAHMHAAVKCTLTNTHTHTQNPPTCARLTVWLSKNKDDYQKPQLLDGAFKNADEPQRTLHLVPNQCGVKARDLICTEEHPTAGQSNL